MSQSSAYYKMDAYDICATIKEKHKDVKKVTIDGIELLEYAQVYPSHEFRTTKFILRSLKNFVMGKAVCDMGCGPGIMGIFSLINGAAKVVQADINPHAVENAQENNKFHGFTKDEIQTYFSDCFDSIPKQQFDIIIFNIPFHNTEIEIVEPLLRAFYDPDFASTKKFLRQAINYSHPRTDIYIAFSSKGNCPVLENIFSSLGYKWSLWRTTNSDAQYDNRIYRLNI